MARLEGVQRKLCEKHDSGLIKLDRKLRKELDNILYQEELLWFQQSREDWICSGDRNTRFYHSATNVKKTMTMKYQINGQNGDVIIDEENMKLVVRDFFNNIFIEDNQNRNVDVGRGAFNRVDREV